MNCTINTPNGVLLVQREVRQGSREYQEDASAIVRVPGFPLTLCAILDGMGGQEGGLLTARLGLHLIVSKFLTVLSIPNRPSLDVLAEDCIRYAQSEIARMINAQWNPGATALVGILDEEGTVGISWLGDSLAVSVEGTEVMLLTRPHNCSCDAEFKLHYPKAQGSNLTRFIGRDGLVLSPDRMLTKVEPGRRIVMGSDGILPLLNEPAYTNSANALAVIPDRLLSDNASIIELSYEEVGPWNTTEHIPYWEI